jgi:hypothetical protein
MILKEVKLKLIFEKFWAGAKLKPPINTKKIKINIKKSVIIRWIPFIIGFEIINDINTTGI